MRTIQRTDRQDKGESPFIQMKQSATMLQIGQVGLYHLMPVVAILSMNAR